MSKKIITARNITEHDIGVVRVEAIEAGDIGLIAACDALLDWKHFDPNAYQIPAGQLGFRFPREALDIVVGAASKQGRQSQRVVIEIMPIQLRESHRAARNSGEYPRNGAERYLADREQAEVVVSLSPDWAYIVRSALPTDYDLDQLPEE